MSHDQATMHNQSPMGIMGKTFSWSDFVLGLVVGALLM